MKYMRLLRSGLCVGATFALLVLPLQSNATAQTSTKNVLRFELCSINTKSVLLDKDENANAWRFVITLNAVGTEQFRELQKRHYGELIEVAWDGLSFGKRRLNIAGLSNVKELHLFSHRLLDLRTAQKQIDLLKERLLAKKNLNAPCGSIEEPGPNAT